MIPLNELVRDIRGQVCPSTLLVALRNINENIEAISQGKLVLKIITDSRDAMVTIPNAVRNMGLESQVEKLPEGHYMLSITRDIEV